MTGPAAWLPDWLTGWVMQDATEVPGQTPLGALARGLLAGLAGTAALTALYQLKPSDGSKKSQPSKRSLQQPPPPQQRFDPQAVRQWQLHAQAPAAYLPQLGDGSEAGDGQSSGRGSSSGQGSGKSQSGHGTSYLPPDALAEASQSGPEGAAQQFAFKLAFSAFGASIRQHQHLIGLVTYFVIGSGWGGLYGLYQSSYHQRPVLAGAAFGSLVWLAGPVAIGPALGATEARKRGPLRLLLSFASHVFYGVGVAMSFQYLEKRAQ